MSNKVKAPAQRRPADSTTAAHLLNPGPGPRKSSKHSSRHHHNGDDPSGFGSSSSLYLPSGSITTANSNAPEQQLSGVKSSLLQPRVAVALGLSRRWHPLLFACRLFSIAPSIWWGFPSALRLLAMLHLVVFGGSGLSPAAAAAAARAGLHTTAGTPDMTFETRLRLTETVLAIIWCGASGYLSFFFTDHLMSRWLVHYTPQATLVRLCTISVTNAYLTSCALWITGGSADPRLLLPAWIAIATTLTSIYHATQRKINIRKETSMSISIFSMASFISMVALLALVCSSRTDYPSIPLLAAARWAWLEGVKVAFGVLDYGNFTGGEYL
ncbi:N-glycosylation protein-domain-containing protein [Podospora conica]|nr:N-glycosylation protein-domain-containing protein [Schizothecium conicum]